MVGMTLRQIVTEAVACDVLREAIRRGSMIYQYDLKIEVARHYGLTWEEVDLPYAEWEALRDKYLKERNEQATHPDARAHCREPGQVMQADRRVVRKVLRRRRGGSR